MAITTEELNIKVKVDSSGVDAGIRDIKAKLAELNIAASDKNTTNLKALADQMKGLANISNSLHFDLSGITGLVSQMNKLSEMDTTKAARGIVGSMKAMLTEVKALSNAAASGGLSQAVQPIVKFTQEINDSISQVDLEKFSQYAKSLQQVASAYKALNGSTSGSSGSSRKQDVSMMVDLTKRMTNLKPRFFIDAYKNFVKIMRVPFMEFGETFGGYGKGANNLFRSISRIAFYRAIRTGLKLVTQSIKTGIENLYQWAGLVGNSFKPAMDSLATSFQYLQNSIGAAISPLIEMAAPVFEYIINAAVAVLNVLNQLFSILGGKTTYRRAIRQNKEYAKAANAAAGGAGALNDELERTILAFDEINKLNGTKDKAGGGGGGGADIPDYAGMFEEVEIDNGLAEILRQESWESVGIALTDKLADAMESINWDSIQEKTEEIATKVATLLNGAFSNKRFWIDLGTTIGEGLNTYTLLDTTFFHTTDFEDFGDSLAEALRQAIITIDWTQLGEASVSVPTAILEAIHGFVDNWTYEDFLFVGNKIAEMMNGALLELPLDTAIPDFVELATGIVASINRAIENIKWSEILGKIATGFKNADWAGLISELGKFLWNTKWVIAIALTLEIGKIGLSLAATALKAKILSALLNGGGGLFGTGAAGAATGGGLVLSKAIPIVAGLALSIGGVVSYAKALDTESIWDDVIAAVASGLGGFMAGAAIFGVAGGVLTMTIPLIINIVSTIKHNTDEHIETQQDEFAAIAERWRKNAVFSEEEIKAIELGLNSTSASVRVEASAIVDAAKDLDHASTSYSSFADQIKTLGTLPEARAALENTTSLVDAISGAQPKSTKSKGLYQSLRDSYDKAMALTNGFKTSMLKVLNIEEPVTQQVESAGASTLKVTKTYSAANLSSIKALRSGTLTDMDMEAPINTRVTSAMSKAVSGFATGAINSKTEAGILRGNVLAQMSMADDMLRLSNNAMSHFKKGLSDALNQITTSAGSLRSAIVNSLTINLVNEGRNIGAQFADGFRSQANAVSTAATAVINSLVDGLSSGNFVGYGNNAIAQFVTGAKNAAPTAKDAGYHARKYLVDGLSSGDFAGYGNNAIAQFVAGIRNAAPAAQDAGYHVRNYLINGLATSSQHAYQWGADAGANFANGIRSQMGAVSNAAASVAQAMRAYLHFSEPDVGPLSDASTYMPDFMMLMAEGIRANAWRVKAEVDNVATMMRPNLNTNANYSIDSTVGGGMASALTEALGNVTMQTNGNVPINVYIGGEKLDSLNARSQARTNFRSGGR